MFSIFNLQLDRQLSKHAFTIDVVVSMFLSREISNKRNVITVTVACEISLASSALSTTFFQFRKLRHKRHNIYETKNYLIYLFHDYMKLCRNLFLELIQFSILHLYFRKIPFLQTNGQDEIQRLLAHSRQIKITLLKFRECRPCKCLSRNIYY